MITADAADYALLSSEAFLHAMLRHAAAATLPADIVTDAAAAAAMPPCRHTLRLLMLRKATGATMHAAMMLDVA